MRAAMVESQLRTSDVDDQRVIAAMAHVAREEFVPAERRAMAYVDRPVPLAGGRALNRSEEHTSELQSLMRISYAVFCLKKKNKRKQQDLHTIAARTR